MNKLAIIFVFSTLPILSLAQTSSKQDDAYSQAYQNIGYIEGMLTLGRISTTRDILKFCQKLSFAKGVSQAGAQAVLSVDLEKRVESFDIAEHTYCETP